MERCLILVGLLAVVLLFAVGCSRGDCEEGYCPADPDCPCPDPCPCGPDCRCCEDADAEAVPVETGDQPAKPTATEPADKPPVEPVSV
jgi:hypothetical protein